GQFYLRKRVVFLRKIQSAAASAASRWLLRIRAARAFTYRSSFGTMSELGVEGLSLEDSQSSMVSATSAEAKKAAKEAAKAAKEAAKAERAQQRGVKAAVMTQPDPEDPLREQYGDYAMVQSKTQSGRAWHKVESLGKDLSEQKVLVRARIHTTRGKGKSAFLVLRQRTATVQAVLFADDQIVSKGMVKYATQIPKESIVDVEGVITVPQQPIEACSQRDVELQVTAIHAVSRAAALPFELVDASRSERVDSPPAL
ncbi:hypothetical protein Vretimale_14134, partial [Volvox reticuliferus]